MDLDSKKDPDPDPAIKGRIHGSGSKTLFLTNNCLNVYFSKKKVLVYLIDEILLKFEMLA